eukprot:2244622-Alexandrium_andersonii.AAC.1
MFAISPGTRHGIERRIRNRNRNSNRIRNRIPCRNRNRNRIRTRIRNRIRAGSPRYGPGASVSSRFRTLATGFGYGAVSDPRFGFHFCC